MTNGWNWWKANGSLVILVFILTRTFTIHAGMPDERVQNLCAAYLEPHLAPHLKEREIVDLSEQIQQRMKELTDLQKSVVDVDQQVLQFIIERQTRIRATIFARAIYVYFYQNVLPLLYADYKGARPLLDAWIDAVRHYPSLEIVLDRLQSWKELFEYRNPSIFLQTWKKVEYREDEKRVAALLYEAISQLPQARLDKPEDLKSILSQITRDHAGRGFVLVRAFLYYLTEFVVPLSYQASPIERFLPHLQFSVFLVFDCDSFPLYNVHPVDESRMQRWMKGWVGSLLSLGVLDLNEVSHQKAYSDMDDFFKAFRGPFSGSINGSDL